ncbi:hypothetical protein [Nakamurella deserti]|uniref:hypothetical protein n=1 Tax=Nakamurella deserti TaxID=2164074 RepID=UPI000DBE7178|nr:hypothetical protein [Nakamurella deserti]
MTDPRRSGDAGKSSEQILAEALRARAGGTPRVPTRSTATARPVAARPPMTIVQLVLAAAIAGLVIGILAAVLTLV